FSSRRRHTRSKRDWSSDVCSSDLEPDKLPFPANGVHSHPGWADVVLNKHPHNVAHVQRQVCWMASGFSRLVYIYDEDCGVLLARELDVLAFAEGFGVGAVHAWRDVAGFVAAVGLFKVARN